MKEMIDKVTPLQQKMSFDTTNRMGSTLSVLRACRVLDYQFVSNTPLNAWAQGRHSAASTNPQLCSTDTSIERRVIKLSRSFSKRDIKTN